MSRTTAFILILLLSVPTLFSGLGKRGLWNPVEPRYAGISAEILRHGRWLVPTYNGRLYDQKPGLFFWMNAASLTGAKGRDSRLFWVRFPSALGGLLLALGCCAFGCKLFDERAGFLAAVIVLTSWYPVWSSRFCHMDSLMAAAIVWTLYFLYAQAQTEKRNWGLLVAATLTTSIGLLLKGPAVLAFCIITAAMTALVLRDRRYLMSSGLWTSCFVAVLVGTCWLIPAWRQAGDGWARELLVECGILHLYDSSNSPKHDALYYPKSFFVFMAPWSFLLPAVLMSALTAKKRAVLSAKESEACLFCAAWLVAGLVVVYAGTTLSHSLPHASGRTLCPLGWSAPRHCVLANAVGGVVSVVWVSVLAVV